MEIQDEYLGVKFTDWRNDTIYNNGELNKKWTCRLCNKNFRAKGQHIKRLDHKTLYSDFEDKRYDYVRSECIKKEKERDEYIKQEKKKKNKNN